MGFYPGQQGTGAGLTKQRVSGSLLGVRIQGRLCPTEGDKCDIQSGRNWKKVSLGLAVVYLVSGVTLPSLSPGPPCWVGSLICILRDGVGSRNHFWTASEMEGS